MRDTETDVDQGGLKRSCTFCKRRKIKCNRETPCSSCLKFSNPNCEYVIPAPRPGKAKVRKSVKKTLEEENKLLKEMIERLQRHPFVNGSKDYQFISYNFNSEVPNLEDLYNLENAENMEFDEQFEDLIKLIQDNDCDVEFNLMRDYSMIVDREPARSRHYGILSWKAMTINDKPLAKLWDYRLGYMRKENQRLDIPIHSKIDADNSNKVQNILSDAFRPLKEVPPKNGSADTEMTIVSDSENHNDINYSKTNEKGSFLDGTNTKAKHNGNKSRPLKIFSKFKNNIEGNHLVEDTSQLKKNIEEFLPAKYIIWDLIDMYFARLYSFLPVVDECDFRANMTRIFENCEPNQKCYDLHFDNKLDFAHIGMLLFIMRLAYLTLLPTISSSTAIGNREGLSDQQVNVLLANPISLEAVSLGNDCVNTFNLFGPINFTIFQLVLITRMYSIYGPECGDGPDYGDATLLNSLLFQLAYSLGLHRDPDKLQCSRNPPNKNLVRKIWSVLLMIDLNHSFEYGDPLNILKYSYDTKLPIFSIESSNVRDLDTEKFVIECFQFLDVSYKPLISLLKEISDVNGSLKVVLLCKKIRYLRYRLFETQHFIMDFVQSCSDVESKRNVNILKFKIQIQFSYFVCSLYYYLFLFFESRNVHEVAFYYLTNLLQKLLLVMFPFYFELNNSTQFTPMIDFLLVPGIENMVHKCIIFLISLCVRIRFHVIHMIESPDHFRLLNEDIGYKKRFDKLQDLFHMLLEVVECFNVIPMSYSLRYFYSWIICKFSRFFLGDVVSEEFRAKVYDESMKFPIFDDELKVSKMVEILQLCLNSKNSMTSKGLMKCEPYVRNDADLLGKNYGKKQPFGPNIFGGGLDRMDTSTEITPESNVSMELDSEVPLTGNLELNEIDNLWMQLLGKENYGDNGFYDNLQPPSTNNGIVPPSNEPDYSSTLDSLLYQELFQDF